MVSPRRSASIDTSSAADPGAAYTAASRTKAMEEVRHCIEEVRHRIDEMHHCSTFLSYHSALAQHDDRVAVGPGEALLGRLPPRQPGEGGVLGRRQSDGQPVAQGHAKDVLGVMDHPRGVAMAPLLEDLESIDHVPARQPALRGV